MVTTTFTSSVLPPHERGVELGRRFAGEVAETVARYRRLFTTRAGGTFDVDLWSARAWATIERVAPAHAEEIAGIAAGAGLTVEQVASVNARFNWHYRPGSDIFLVFNQTWDGPEVSALNRRDRQLMLKVTRLLQR